MHDVVKGLLLALLKVPPEPQAPAGSAGSVRIFRASRNFYLLNLVKWGITQAAAVLGISIILLLALDRHFPKPLGTIIRIGEVLGFLGLAMQMPFTYFMVRLDYEMRWYIVTDRSLRIRHGIARVREMTMTFANVQQIVVCQGPLQRLLKIADVQVTTAGGGGGNVGDGGHGHGLGESMHLGYFHGVDNAEEIRDLIIDRLRRFRDTGLGDPDEITEMEVTSANQSVGEAAREFLQEARSLRSAFEA